MARKYVISGAASGIGKATAALLRDQGHQVIGVDLRDVEISADLGTEAGRRFAVEEVSRLSGGTIDGLILAAGLASNSVATARVNYFGAIANLEGLQPLLAKSDSPRAVVITSVGGTSDFDPELLEALEAGDENKAAGRAEALLDVSGLIYKTSKRALNRWVRRHAATPKWAGEGIALNGVGPGMVETPMIAATLSTPEGRERLLSAFPMPYNGIAQPEDIGRVLIWLCSPENTHVTGQIIFADGGAEVSNRELAVG